MDAETQAIRDMDAALDKIERLKAELIEAEREWVEAKDRMVLSGRSRMIGESP